MKDTYYFPHNSNLHRDPKIGAMLTTYGFEGYGWYNALLEIMREQDNYRLPINTKYAYKTLSRTLDTTEKKAQKFIDDCVNEFNLFKRDDECLWSEDLLYSMATLDEKRQQRQEAVNKRWEKIRAKSAKTKEASDTTVVRPQYDCNTDVIQVKESKVNQSILDHSKINHSISEQIKPKETTSEQTGVKQRIVETNTTVVESKDQTVEQTKESKSGVDPTTVETNQTPRREAMTRPTPSTVLDVTDDLISIRNCPDDRDVFFKNDYLFISNEFMEDLKYDFNVSESELRGIFNAMSTDPTLGTHEGSYQEYVRSYIEGVPEMR